MQAPIATKCASLCPAKLLHTRPQQQQGHLSTGTTKKLQYALKARATASLEAECRDLIQPLLNNASTRLPCLWLVQVIPCPNTGKNTSSHGSSEQTGTQRTEPSADYVLPSTRTATGSLPSRSRSSYSWGSEGQAPGPQGADNLTRTASNAAHAANARAMQPTPQVCRDKAASFVMSRSDSTGTCCK